MFLFAGRAPWARSAHRERLITTEGIFALGFFCHADLWDQLSELMKGRRDWRQPTGVRNPFNDLVEVTLSGPNVVAMLDQMRLWTGGTGYRRALSRRVYTALAEVVDQVDPGQPAAPLPAVVLGDFALGSG